MYLFVGLCKLGTKFCANFEPQRLNYQCIQQQVIISVYSCKYENGFHFELEEKKVLTLHGHLLATLVSQTTCCLADSTNERHDHHITKARANQNSSEL